MLAEGRARVERAGLGKAVRLEAGRAEQLPFADASFDALTFTYLLRYVDDPAATLDRAGPGRHAGRNDRLARVLRSSECRGDGVVALLRGHAALLPACGHVISPGWDEVGKFLGPSIRGFWDRYPLESLLELWRDAGIEVRVPSHPEPRGRNRDLGTPWRLRLHARPSTRSPPAAGATTSRCSIRRTPPGTSRYVVIGAALAPGLRRSRRSRRCSWRSSSRVGDRRPRARRAERAPAANRHPVAGARRCSPPSRLRSPPRSGSSAP